MRSRGGPCSCAQLRTRQGRPRWAISNTPSPPRGAVSARVVHEPWCPKTRGRRECRAPRSARSLACSVENTRVSHHGQTGNARHSPRDGFNGFLRALPGEPGLLSPSPRNAKHCRELTPASGRQDHTTSPSALPVFAKRLRRAKAPFVFGAFASTWGNRGSELPLNWSQPTMEAGGCSPIGWKYGLTTGRRAQTSNGEQPWKNISVSTCR